MRFKNSFFILFFTIFITSLAPSLYAQSVEMDSVRSLSAVTVKSFDQSNKKDRSTSVYKTGEIQVPFTTKVSFVAALNTVAGMRMEERSPGSYRVNIRGSSLRSPFGVRNIKVYWNDVPMTDPGGNTYFNQFVYNNFSFIQVFKGPSSSIYGQGTGGALLIGNELKYHNTGIEYITGSYNYHSISAKALWGNDSTGRSMVTFTHNQGDGFRNQTKMRRDNVSWISEMNINKKHSINASVLYADMYYQTPGGLNLKEFQQNPRASRPAVANFPSAKDVNAAIWQKTFTASITHKNIINQSFEHKTTLYGAIAQVKNSAIRNFERRSEPHFGGRTMLTYNKKLGAGLQHTFVWNNGFEFQQGYFNTQVAKNKNGMPDTLQANDDIHSSVYSFITQGSLQITSKWNFIAGASLNKSRLKFTRLSSYPVRDQVFEFKNEFAPRVGILHRFERDWTVAGNVSKGFSPPTIAELLPSTGIITPLNAEQGWNYELITRKRISPLNLYIDVSTYLFRLANALVQRRDEAGADYFIKAGAVNQKGIEAGLNQTFFGKQNGIIDYFENRLSYTFSHFRYGNFIKGSDDFTGKTVPGVPQHCLAYIANTFFNNGLNVNLNYYAASKIFMNDANTEATEPYYLLGLRVGYKRAFNQKIAINIYTGAENLLNQIYSLGNDINAAGGRYYNVAPGRNYYAGIAFELLKNNTGKR